MLKKNTFEEDLTLTLEYLMKNTTLQLTIFDYDNEDIVQYNSYKLIDCVKYYLVAFHPNIDYLRTCPIFYEQFSVELCRKIPVFMYLAVKVNPETLKKYLLEIKKIFSNKYERNEAELNSYLFPVLKVIFEEYEESDSINNFQEQIDTIIELNPSINAFDQNETFLSMVGIMRPDFIIKKLQTLKKKGKNIEKYGRSKLIRQISIILESLIYIDGIGKNLMHRECDFIRTRYYLKGIDKFLPYIFDIELPLEIFTGPGFDKLTALFKGEGYNKLSAFLQFPGAVRIIDFSKTFLSKNLDVRRWIALNPKAIEFNEFKHLLYPETESDKIVRINAFQTLRNNDPDRFEEISHELSSKIEINIPVEFETLPEIEKKSLIEIMNLIGEKFSFIQKGIINKNCTIKNGHIVELFLSGNKLKTIPESIGRFKRLKFLSIGNNYLITLPDSISNLELLEILSLKHNKFQTIPKVVFQLTSLKKLNLGYNELIFLPESIEYLKKLEILDLRGNNFKTLPDSVSKLKNLQELVLMDNNSMSELPPIILKMKSLKLLNIYNVEIENPEILVKLKKKSCIIRQ